MYTKQYQITNAELESGYNHLNHASILSLLEKGRLDYLISVGFPNEQLHQQDIYLVIAHIDIHYKREIFAEAVTVSIDAVKSEGKKMQISQRVINQKGKVCVEAVYDFRVLCGSLKRSIVIPEFVAKAMEMSGL